MGYDDTRTLKLTTIKKPRSTQARAEKGLDAPTVEEYTEAMERGDEFPPVVVFHDGKVYRLADGFHRCAAAAAVGRTEIDAVVHKGDARAAVLFAVASNTKHGLPRTTADKRRAVELLLDDPTWKKWSGRQIAAKAKVSEKLVRTMRQERRNGASGTQEPEVVQYKTKTGKTATQPARKKPKRPVKRRGVGENPIKNVKPGTDPGAYTPPGDTPVAENLHDGRVIPLPDSFRRLLDGVAAYESVIEGLAAEVADGRKVTKKDLRASVQILIEIEDRLGEIRTAIPKAKHQLAKAAKSEGKK